MCGLPSLRGPVSLNLGQRSSPDPVRDPPVVLVAPVVFVVTVVFARTAVKYGDRAIRYVHVEAGHVVQNVLLQATALGVDADPVGAFDDTAVLELLGLSTDYEPLHLLPVGRPRG